MDMDIIWTALGVCVLVGFVFYVLAQYWQRLLRAHSHALRDLTARVQALEEMEDPDFRQKVGESVPSPLEQVYTFSFRLSEQFWMQTLAASPAEIAYVKANGKFLGSVKIERWKSHSVATVYEVLPQSSSAGWQSRSIDVYPGSEESVTLWELSLAAPEGEHANESGASLELRFGKDGLALRAQNGRFSDVRRNGSEPHREENVFFQVPLDTARLAVYRKQDLDEPEGNGQEKSRGAIRSTDSSLSIYELHDEFLGVDWRLAVRDLERKEDWDKWKIWESWEVRRG
jgi:hypothetical protein